MDLESLTDKSSDPSPEHLQKVADTLKERGIEVVRSYRIDVLIAVTGLQLRNLFGGNYEMPVTPEWLKPEVWAVVSPPEVELAM